MELPHTYTDPNGDRLRVSAVNTLTVWSQDTPEDGKPLAGVWAPEGTEAVALARAILAAAGNTEHRVISKAEIDRHLRADFRAGERRMRDRAARTVMSYTDGLDDLAGEVEDLPLLSDDPARTPLTADTDA